MVCLVDIHEKPKLKKPVLIEGLPGIGFVANIATLHLINELKPRLFAEVYSSAFQDLVVSTASGGARTPATQLYYHKSPNGGRDLIIWYGNTQALTTFGQYELCGKVLSVVEELGCHYVITLGGLRQDEVNNPPQIYCTASDNETFEEGARLGAKVMVGQVFGVAGLLVGLCGLRGFKGISFLIETLGTHPDAAAARQALSVLASLLELKVDFSTLDKATEETRKVLESFGLIAAIAEEKKKEEQRFRWSI
jgi:uncharacterized protein (TIGR00162 family)